MGNIAGDDHGRDNRKHAHQGSLRIYLTMCCSSFVLMGLGHLMLLRIIIRYGGVSYCYCYSLSLAYISCAIASHYHMGACLLLLRGIIIKGEGGEGGFYW